MSEVKFGIQMRIFEEHLMKIFDYPDYIKVKDAKVRMAQEERIIDEDIPEIVMFASYTGTLLRTAYYKYVHGYGFDVRALADAAVRVFLFNNVYTFDYGPYLQRKEIRCVIDKTSYPEWTRLGLIGGSTNDIKKHGEQFVKKMETLSRLNNEK